MTRSLRIAVVGSGPAGMYAVGHLLETPGLRVEIDVYERLPTPWGLVRAGVAPDHPEKKQIIERLFHLYIDRPEVRFFGNVDVGTDVQPDELSSWYDAVIYATGASGDTRLGIPGEDLPGCWSAREFVAWYNGHPDQRHLPVDLSCERAVVVGNGNVALDLARILTAPIAELEKTDIADHALHALRQSKVREVVLLGRRAACHGAFHNPELEELGQLRDVQIGVDPDELPNDSSAVMDSADWVTRRKIQTLRVLSQRATAHADKRIVFRFLTSPVELVGAEKVDKLRVVRNRLERDAGGEFRVRPTEQQSLLEAGLVLRAIGYRGCPFPGLPFDDRGGVISNVRGRVTGAGAVPADSYVTGWIKRGPRGIIGSNKKCAAETVGCLLADHAAGRLTPADKSAEDVRVELLQRRPDLVDHNGWRAIDRVERLAGLARGRPRVKMVDVSGMLACAAGRRSDHLVDSAR